MRPADDLRGLVEGYLASLDLAAHAAGLGTVVRYALDPGGKRIRPVLCLAVADAVRGDPETALPAATAVELVHTFSLVHDDLPALDDDAERRGRPSAHVAFGEGPALLAGDALLVEAFRLALSYPGPEVARELAGATLRMISGQYRDVTDDAADLEGLHRLKTGALFSAAVGMALHACRVPADEQRGWRELGEELGLLFQLVDDLLDGDGYARRVGPERTRRLADEAAGRLHERLDAVGGTPALRELVDAIASRTA